MAVSLKEKVTGPSGASPAQGDGASFNPPFLDHVIPFTANSPFAKLVVRSGVSNISDFSVELARYHRQQRKNSIRRFLKNPELIQHIVARRLRRNSSLAIHSSHLSRSAQLCASNAKSFLASTLPISVERFYSRGEQGYVVDCWGGKTSALSIFSIANSQTLSDHPTTTFFLDDLHRDVAIVLTDLLSSAAYFDALQFKEAYFSLMPETYDTNLFRTYFVSEALNHIFLFLASIHRLEKAQRTSPSDHQVPRKEESEIDAAENLRQQTERLCALMNHYSLALPMPFLICIGGSRNSGKTTLAKTLSKTSATVLLQQGQTNNIRLAIESMLSKKVSVVVENVALTHSDKVNLAEFTRRQRIPLIFVKCEATNWPFNNTAQDISSAHLTDSSSEKSFLPPSFGLEFPSLLIEPSLPPEELALYVLRQLGTCAPMLEV